MKVRIKTLFLLPALIAGLGLLPAGQLTAQTFTTLHSFTAAPDPLYTNSDGANPYAGLILAGNTLYGAAADGGSLGAGTVFAVNTDGTGFTILHSFTAISGLERTNSDGARPFAGLILSDNTLYGTALEGGSSGAGTAFRVNTDGTGFTNLHSFTSTSGPGTNSDGAFPYAGLILAGNTLYGTAERGGSSGNGTVFAIHTDGTGFTNLHSFTPLTAPYPGTNSDGASPLAGLILSGNTLYGTAQDGGSAGNGTVFAVNTDGTGFTNLHSFTPLTALAPNPTNSDGANPSAGLILSGHTLYGTAVYGGSSGVGTVFAVNTDGTGFTTLHRFINSDGAFPVAELILADNALYGTTSGGGSSDRGTVFAVNTDGTGFTTLHSFTCTITNPGDYPPHADCDGGYPNAGLILSGNTLYGTGNLGGSSGSGTVFSLSFAPQLAISLSGANVILTWPTNVAGFDYTGFTLQFSTNLVSPAVWCPVSPGPVVVNGQNAVTNPIVGTQQYYQLSEIVISGE